MLYTILVSLIQFKKLQRHPHRSGKCEIFAGEKCPYSEFFWSLFSRIRTEYDKYGVSLRIHSECWKIPTRKTPNTRLLTQLLRLKFVTSLLPKKVKNNISGCSIHVFE